MKRAEEENPRSLDHQLPGEITRDIPGFRMDQPLSEGIKMGNLGNLIEKLHAQGKQIVAKKHPGKIVFLVAASAITIGAIMGGIRLRKRKHG